MIATLSRDDYRQFNENIGILQEAGTEIPFVVTHNEDATFTVELKTDLTAEQLDEIMSNAS